MDKNNAAERLRQHDETVLEEIIREYTPYVSTIIYNVANACMSVSDIIDSCFDFSNKP